MNKELIKKNFNRAIISSGNISDAVKMTMEETPPIGLGEHLYFGELAIEASDFQEKIQKSLTIFQQRIKI